MKSSSFVFMEGVLLLTSAIFMFALIILGYTIADLRCRKIVSAEPDAVLPQQPRHKSLNVFFQKPGRYDKQYGSFPEKVRLEMLKASREMFTFGFDNYMKYAFPQDELNPIDCAGRGPDVDNPSNVNINDVLGDYSLTLVDSLDTLAVMGNVSEFKKAVQLVLDYVSFDKDVTIQVFEANIRLLGGLLSAHFLITDPNQIFGDLRPPNYTRELLDLAHDLATRLLPAFENSSTGLPYPRVNLRHGVPKNENCDWCLTQTCTAGAGSLLLEFGLLSRLVNDPIFDTVARRAARILWRSRAKNTGLLGNVIDVETGEWVGKMSGLGAGLDSFYEYLLKSYILFGEDDDYRMFNESYHLIKRYLRRGRDHCNEGYGNHPLYVNVNMIDGSLLTLWIDSLQAAFAGVQVLNGDIEEAICTHALYYAIWKRYGALPERFNWQHLSPDLAFYPLRPELVESTYLLYQATKNPFYLHVGRDILTSLNNHTRVKCGYATIHNVQDKTLEDRMESFFLSETCKYLYLLFDIENPLNKQPTNFVFSTEGHLFPISWKLRRNVWEEDDAVYKNSANDSTKKNQTQSSCKRINEDRHHLLPLKNNYLHQIVESLSIDDS